MIGLLLSFAAHPVAAQTTSPSKTSFSYQGQLLNSGTPVNATCSFQFTLYDAATGGNPIGTGTDDLEVKDSYFSTQLDFGATAFDGSVRYVAVGVKCPPDTAYTPMTSRVALTSAPTSLVAQQALAAPWSGLTGIPANLTFLNSPGTACNIGQVAKWNGTAWECGIVAGGGTDTLASLTCAAGQVAKRNSANTAWECGDASAGTTFTTAADSGLTLTNSALSVNFATGGTSGVATTAARSDHTHALTAIDGVPIGATTAAAGKFTTLEAASLKVGSPTTGQVLTADANGNATWATLQQAATSSGWSLTGNANTSPGTNFIGTTDSQALEFKVNGTRALRLEPAATNTDTDPPNIIGGYSGNTVTSGVKGATIGGGGAADDNSTGTTIVLKNSVDAKYGTVSGGGGNTASGEAATVGGGYTNKASYTSATVGGGSTNEASGQSATVGGGIGNSASGNGATVPGGQGAKAALFGQMAYANSMFATAGDAQTSVYVLRNTTSDATQTELFLDGSGARLTIGTDRAYFFDVQVVGATSGGGLVAGYDIKGVIKNTAGGMGIKSSSSDYTLGLFTWDATVEKDDTNQALAVKVTGAASTEIRWVATVRTTEVEFPAEP